MAKRRTPTTHPSETKPENGPEAQAPATASAQPAPGNEGTQTEAAGDIHALAAEAASWAEKTRPIGEVTVLVVGPAKGRWRIGRLFTSDPIAIAEADLTPEQMEALESDPHLTVTLVDAPY